MSQRSRLAHLLTFVDDLPEIVGWLLFGSATALVAVDKIGGAEYAALAGLAVVTLVGARRYHGLTVGPVSSSLPPLDRDDEEAP